MMMTVQLDRSPPCTPAVPRGWASSLVSRLALVVLGGLTSLSILAFRAWPDLDLVPATMFYNDDSRFVATEAAQLVRLVLFVTPWIVMTIVLALCLANKSRLVRVWAPCRRGLAVLTLSLALGPGLLVNIILKDNVHRPRPNQTADFGGTLEFRSVGSIEGGCPRNCSFVSGEVAIAAWTMSVALLTPIGIQPVAIAAALLLTGVAGLSRMSVGAHFLSDTLLAMLFTWLVVIVTWWAVFGYRRGTRNAAGSPRPQASA